MFVPKLRWLQNYLYPTSDPKLMEIFNKLVQAYRERCFVEEGKNTSSSNFESVIKQCPLLTMILTPNPFLDAKREFKERAPLGLSRILLPYLIWKFNPFEKHLCLYHVTLYTKTLDNNKQLVRDLTQEIDIFPRGQMSKECMRHSQILGFFVDFLLFSKK